MTHPRVDPLTDLQARIQLANSAEIAHMVAEKAAKVQVLVDRSKALLSELEAIREALELAHSAALAQKCGYDVTHPLSGAINRLKQAETRSRAAAGSAWGKAKP